MPVGKCVMRTAESVMLTCWPPAPPDAEGIDAQVFQLDIDLDLVVDLRIDEHRSERSVPPRVGIERRDAHQPVHADFGLQQAVGVLAVDFEGDRLDARAFAFQPVGDDRSSKSLRSAQRRYMRSSISAQSWLSVPPAPGWMVTMASRASFSPESSIASSSLSSMRREGLFISRSISAFDVFAFARQFEQRVEVEVSAGDAGVVLDALLPGACDPA